MQPWRALNTSFINLKKLLNGSVYIHFYILQVKSIWTINLRQNA